MGSVMALLVIFSLVRNSAVSVSGQDRSILIMVMGIPESLFGNRLFRMDSFFGDGDIIPAGCDRDCDCGCWSERVWDTDVWRS